MQLGKAFLILIGGLLLASGAEAARWKIGTGPAGAQTRATYPSGSCYYDTTDTGPDQCRYKAITATSCQFVQESGANQCTPGTAPAPVGEFVRFEGARAHLYSNDGTLQFDKYADSSGATTLSWKTSSELVVLAVSRTGMTVTRNGVRLAVGTSATDAQMKAIGSLLNNSTAVTRFRLNAAAKLAKAKARAANIVLTAVARGVEDGYLLSGSLVDSLSGDATAIDQIGTDPDHGGQINCASYYEQAIWQYFNDYQACYHAAVSFDGHPGWYAGSMAGETWACAVAYTARAEAAWFQMLACMAIPKL